MLNIIVQILLGIFVILIMGFIAYSIFDNEYAKSFRIAYSNKKETKIFTGIYPFNLDGAAIETINKNDPYYLDINPSVNQNGGAEYSYNFWLYFNINEKGATRNIITKEKDGTTDINKDKFIVLFYKGLKQMIPYKQNQYSCDSDSGINNDSKPYYLVKNPLIKMNNNGTELVVEYNNINTPDTFNSSAVKLDCNTISTNYKMYETNVNKLGIKNINTDMYNKTWNMITVVMQESPSNEEKLFTNRTNCKVYFNSTLVADRSTFNNDMNDLTNDNAVSTVMKNNIGRLYINPKKNATKNNDIINTISNEKQSDNITDDSPVKMADMSYFNYALNDDDILILYKRGFSKEISDLSTRIMGLDKAKFIQGTKFNYNLSTDVDKIMPVEPI